MLGIDHLELPIMETLASQMGEVILSGTRLLQRCPPCRFRLAPKAVPHSGYRSADRMAKRPDFGKAGKQIPIRANV